MNSVSLQTFKGMDKRPERTCILPWILSTLGVIFGAIGWYQAKTYPEKYTGVGFGITGVVLGTCSLIYKIYLLVSVMNYLGNLFA